MATGRFAPSPSGPLHLGNLRTALAAWLLARSTRSPFLLRIEDLDPAACREEHVASHQRDLERLGLTWDGPVWRQSQRADAYAAALARLEDDGVLYRCYCTRREVLEAAQAPHGDGPDGAYPGTCRRLTRAEQAEREADGRPPALRLRATVDTLTFTDRLAGERTGAVDDFIVRRRDGGAAYNLAVVVDDAAQGIEEVVRGDDLLPTTPRQLHVADRLGVARPAHAHVPLVVGPDGERLAKRHGAVTLDDRLALGDRPVDVLATLARSLGLRVPDAAEEAGSVTDLLDLLVAGFDPPHFRPGPWTAPVAPARCD